MLPAIEKRDFVMPRESRRHQVTPDKSGSAKNQQLQSIYTVLRNSETQHAGY